MWHVEGEYFAAAAGPFEHLFLKKKKNAATKVLKLKISKTPYFYF